MLITFVSLRISGISENIFSINEVSLFACNDTRKKLKVIISFWFDKTQNDVLYEPIIEYPNASLDKDMSHCRPMKWVSSNLSPNKLSCQQEDIMLPSRKIFVNHK